MRSPRGPPGLVRAQAATASRHACEPLRSQSGRGWWWIPGPAAYAGHDVVGGRAKLAQPVARPGELEPEHAEAERDHDDGGSRQHHHRDADQHDCAAYDGDGDAPRPWVSD